MSPTPRAAPGQLLDGRFLLKEEIGRGGMSTVFKAEDLALGGHCAVKMPLPLYASGVGSWSMFQREAEIGARLDHPSLLRFVALPPDRRRSYVVTEFIDGTSLASRVGRGRRLPEPEAFRLMQRICDAVDYLHRQGIVHYDLKPGNVVFCDDGSLRVIDFGMAHEVATRRLGSGGSVPPIATSDYVAPEQIRRKRGQTSVDVYALGAMLYEMLTGAPPFENDDPFVVASARQIGDPRAPRAKVPSISREAEEIVLRALRRNPKERYASVANLARDIAEPGRVQVSGLCEHLVEVTPLRKGLRWLRYLTVVGVAPLAVLALSFRVLWLYLEHKR